PAPTARRRGQVLAASHPHPLTRKPGP
ncbi:Cd(II)/Pb(II)-responsive transcriptional regulator, partial [Verminephrobacter sp. Larva24]